MSRHAGAGGGLDYYPCHYGESRTAFRGPKRRLKSDYVAFLGGTETYGRFVPAPFPALLEQGLGLECANFGAVNAGLDLYLNDPVVLDLATRARLRVMQITGAQNMSNRYYQVHPRRNDRFLRASERLTQLFPEVDFTEFHFTRHMLGHLAEVSRPLYDQVVSELRSAWVARMKHVLTVLRGPTVLLWFADQPPPEDDDTMLDNDPLFVTRAMLDALRPRVAGLVEYCPSDVIARDGTQGMVFDEYDLCAAERAPGPRAHAEAAEALMPAIGPLLRRDAA